MSGRCAMTMALAFAASLVLQPSAADDLERSGEEVVRAKCVECHATGQDGAPRIGHRDEWIPRFGRGLDFTIRSAIHGHGTMPPRGGMADLTDPEIRAAILYMFNPAGYPAAAVEVVPDAGTDPYHKVIAGTEIFLGIVASETIRERYPAGSTEALMHGGVPAGREHYHLNVTLFDAVSRSLISDARVVAGITRRGAYETTKQLETTTLNGIQSYGQYFRMPSGGIYMVTVRIQRPGIQRAIEAEFEFDAFQRGR